MSLLTRVCAHLAEAGASHALIGAAALGVHGVSRSTNDIDLFTTDRGCLDDSFWASDSLLAVADIRRGASAPAAARE